MSYSIYAKADSSTSRNNSLCFYETSDVGIFDGEVSLGATKTTVTSELSGFRLVVVPTSSFNSRNQTSWTSTTSAVTHTPIGMLTKSTGASLAANEYTVTSGDLDVRLIITDEHGSHTGCPTGQYFKEGQFIGVRHVDNSESGSGYVFGGIEVTLSSNSAGTIFSEGGSTSGLVTTFPADYEGAIVIQCGYFGSITIKFLYDIVPFTITLNGNGGTFSGGQSTYTESVNEGDDFEFTSAKEPTRTDGYTFAHWVDSEGTIYNTGSSVEVNADMSFFAVWSVGPVGTYTITLNANGGTFSSGESTYTESVTQGDAFEFSASKEPTRTDYTLEYWSGNGTTQARGSTFTPTESTTFLAIWSGGPTPVRPDSEKDYMIRSDSSEYLIYSVSSGSLVYAV